ncbi:hypothetical protein C8R44DRAFT_744108 [Mycena epipterygia]|nr:hypothetical protein C8R44DRAFT_744108 [Mycena epipterygia]
MCGEQALIHAKVLATTGLGSFRAISFFEFLSVDLVPKSVPGIFPPFGLYNISSLIIIVKTLDALQRRDWGHWNRLDIEPWAAEESRSHTASLSTIKATASLACRIQDVPGHQGIAPAQCSLLSEAYFVEKHLILQAIFPRERYHKN